MSDELDTSVDTSIDTSGSDFSGSGGFDGSVDVGGVMDDSADVGDFSNDSSDIESLVDNPSDVGSIMDDSTEFSGFADQPSDVADSLDSSSHIEMLMDEPVDLGPVADESPAFTDYQLDFESIADNPSEIEGSTGEPSDVTSAMDDVGDVEPYHTTPSSDIPILQADGTADTLENIMTASAEADEAPLDVEPYLAIPNSDIPILQEDSSVTSLEEIMAANAEANAIDGVKSPDQKIAEDVSAWINEINPNFDPYDWNSPYCNNCGSCAFAVEQRFEGSPDIAATSENIGTVEEMNTLTGMEQVAMSPEEIQDYLISRGPGSHGIVGIDRVSGPGHWFNAYYDGQKVVAIDGQTGQVTDWPPDYGDVINWDISVRKEVK